MSDKEERNFIQNLNEYEDHENEYQALSILEAGYQAIKLEKIIEENVRLKDGILNIGEEAEIVLDDYERVFVYCIGKCSPRSGPKLEEILGRHIHKGMSYGVSSSNTGNMEDCVGTHPFPSENNINITTRIFEELHGLSEKDLVLCVISGGGSSLLCMPHQLDCVGMTELTQYLMSHGATIEEINTVRKHTSQIQGGNFARKAHPARVVSLLISDVPGDDPGLIASGPTVKDTSTIKDAERVIRKYEIDKHPELGKCILFETPKEDVYFENVTNIVILNNQIMLKAMEARAQKLGYEVAILSNSLEGQVEETAQYLLAEKHKATCCLCGGETTVKITNPEGKGGRCQELALYAGIHINEDTIILAASSDGRDNTDVAGAVMSKRLREKAEIQNLDMLLFLETNTSYNFFKQVGGHIVTGQTGVNVSDVYMVLRPPAGDDIINS